MPLPSIKSKVLFVEGKDEVNFFSSFLQHLGIESIYIKDISGIDNLAISLIAFLKSGYQRKAGRQS